MNNAFLNALPIIVNALADKLGVKVRMNAGRASTDGKVVYLPAIDADDKGSCVKALGFCVHEGGGHCRFTDFSVLEGGLKPIEKHVWNILEDIRVESCISGLYPGARLYLADTVTELVKDGFFSPPNGDEGPAELLQAFMLMTLRNDVLGQTSIEPLALAFRAGFEKTFPLGMQVKFEALMYEVRNCKNSHEVLELARAIITMMEDEAKKEEEQRGSGEQPKPGDQGGDKSDQIQSGDSAGGQDDQGGDAGDVAGQSTGSQASTAQDELVTATTGADAIRQVLAAVDGDGMKGVGEMLADSLAQGTASSEDASCAAPLRFQRYRPVDADPDKLDKIKQRVGTATNALRVRTQSLLQARTLTRVRSGYLGARLNLKNLHQAPLGGPVFVKKHKGISIDTAIMMLVDNSPSMNRNGRHEVALDSVCAATMAFERPDVKTAVVAFPYQRDCNVVLKDWREHPTSALSAYSMLTTSGSTPMAQAMLGAGMMLMQRPEKRKILLVVTDGDPDNKEQALWVIDLARRSGIEVLGLGIELDVSHVFSEEYSASVDTVNDLPVAMISLLEGAVLKMAA